MITALERTFLGHLRTSVALATASILISQLYTLSLGAEDPNAHDEVALRHVGKPLSCFLLVWAITTTIAGAYRFMRMQDALLEEAPVINGGWELHIESLGIFVASLQTLRTNLGLCR